jgi:hypothetical protein
MLRMTARKTVIAGGMAAALAASLGGVAVADNVTSAQAGGRTPLTATKTAARIAAVPVAGCSGGAQKSVRSTLSNQPTTFGEGPGVALPGPVVVGPLVGADTLNVTFSAESQLRGGKADRFDWVQLEVLLDGTPLQPAGPATSPMALTGSPYYAMTTAQFCGRIGPGRHTLRAQLKIVDNGTNDPLSAWIDDWVLKGEVSD